jgi:hypothetical protein
VRAATHAAIAQPTRRGAAARHGSKRWRSARGIAREGQSAGTSAAAVPGSGWALRCRVPSAFSRRGASRASRAAAPGGERPE